jgi:hypothetical protein
MKKLVLIFSMLLSGLSFVQAQEASSDATKQEDSSTGCCQNLKIGLNGGVGIAAPDFIRLNTNLRLNSLKPIPSEYVFTNTLLWVQTGRFRYAFDYGQGVARKEYPNAPDSLNVAVNHRFMGLQVGYSIFQSAAYDVNVFAAVYDHRTNISYTPILQDVDILNQYLSTRYLSKEITHNIATARLGASFDYYFNLFSNNCGKDGKEGEESKKSSGFNLPLSVGATFHAGVPLTRGTWNYENNGIRDAVYVNPMSWSMSARIGFLLNAK